MKIYPVGLHRKVKEDILKLVPEEKRDEARRLLRTAEENAVIFARVSRAAGTMDSIAAEIDEEGAAKFHEKWTVSVEGYGHKSVGEHAMIQIAVEDVSSGDIDRITDNRLASYTEFSARFKGRQSRGYFTPKVVAEDLKLLKLWDEAHQALFSTCDDLTEKSKAWIISNEAQKNYPEVRQGYYRSGETEQSWQSRLVKHAADQFKNLLPVSRLSSVGVTVNATEAENMLRKLLSSSTESGREVGNLMKKAALEVAPTLVKYAEYNPYLASMDKRREVMIIKFGLIGKIVKHKGDEAAQTHLITSKDPETLILAAFAFESNKTGSFADLVKIIEKFDKSTKEEMFKLILGSSVDWDDFAFGKVKSEGLTYHDMPPRAFEFDGGYIYEMPDMTYGDWRDYKRHRIQSYMAKPLNIKWGYMIPPLAYILDQSSNKEFHGSVKAVKAAVEKAEKLFKEIEKVSPSDAQYVVTRLHFRPAIARFNMREAFHLLKLRTGDNAHAFVRRLMWPTVDLLMDKHPNIASHLPLRGKRIKIAFP